MDDRIDILGMRQERLREWATELGQPAFRATQIFKWLYQKRASSFAEMTDVSKKFRARMQAEARISTLELASRHDGNDGTTKLIWRLHDGLVIESVLIPEEKRLTLCISSQVGCALDCDFCVTGKGGFARDLSAAEIMGQVLQSQDVSERRISNIVLMGMGEPLLNLDAVLEAMDVCMDDQALGISHRRITLSTSGLPHKMREMAERSPINLAISLHATTQEGRQRIMPISRKYPLDEVLGVIREIDLRKKYVTIEYTLLRGVNDDLADARRLVRLLQGLPVKVNLIPYNPSPLTSYERPDWDDIVAYQNVLLRAGYATTVRRNRGNDVNAACGQLGGYAQKRPRLRILQDHGTPGSAPRSAAPGAAAVAANATHTAHVAHAAGSASPGGSPAEEASS